MDGLDPTEIACPPRAPSVAVLDGCSTVMLLVHGIGYGYGIPVGWGKEHLTVRIIRNFLFARQGVHKWRLG